MMQAAVQPKILIGDFHEHDDWLPRGPVVKTVEDAIRELHRRHWLGRVLCGVRPLPDGACQAVTRPTELSLTGGRFEGIYLEVPLNWIWSLEHAMQVVCGLLDQN